jgi:DNA-binding response OmpR family regulator
MIIKVDDAPIELSTLEYRLVAYLMHQRGQVVPQSELVEHVYGSDQQTSNAVEVLVARVRKKMGGGFIETRRGFGYLIAEESE